VTDKADPTLQCAEPAFASYEVQILAGRNWVTELVLADRQEAEAEAIRAYESGRRLLGVRVRRESVDDRTALINSATVFRRMRDDKHGTEEQEERRLQVKAAAADKHVDRRRAARVQAASKEQAARQVAERKARLARRARRRAVQWAWPLVLMVVLLIGGAGALIKLHTLFFGS
jgi:hypothetical protein